MFNWRQGDDREAHGLKVGDERRVHHDEPEDDGLQEDEDPRPLPARQDITERHAIKKNENLKIKFLLQRTWDERAGGCGAGVRLP